jgi:hypothetical protein
LNPKLKVATPGPPYGASVNKTADEAPKPKVLIVVGAAAANAANDNYPKVLIVAGQSYNRVMQN